MTPGFLMSRRYGDVHCMPIGDLVDHDMSRTCWCQPKLRAVCPERCEDSCWACEDGMVEGFLETMEAIIVSHHAADGRL